jgi:hypothetical protein
VKSEPITVTLTFTTEKAAREFLRIYSYTPSMMPARNQVRAELVRRRGLKRASRVAREILNG